VGGTHGSSGPGSKVSGVALLLSTVWRRKRVNLEGASGEREPTGLWPAGPDGLWARKGRWAGW
jgi:hypothetical protein